jgi:hypothetical protein
MSRVETPAPHAKLRWRVPEFARWMPATPHPARRYRPTYIKREDFMGQSMGSTGNSHKQGGAGNQSHNQPEARPGQKMSDQGGHEGGKGSKPPGKPDGGADHGPRSTR